MLQEIKDILKEHEVHEAGCGAMHGYACDCGPTLYERLAETLVRTFEGRLVSLEEKIDQHERALLYLREGQQRIGGYDAYDPT